MKKILLFVAVSLLALAGIAVVLGLLFDFASFETIAVKTSPDGSHSAKLEKYYVGININYRLSVDGEEVYWSRDFVPGKLDFREQIVWDSTGKNIIFEIGGKRLFGYDVNRKSSLTKDELLSVEYTPFSEMGF